MKRKRILVADYFITLYSLKKNATFPNTPLTALHNDEEQLKHIKAVYTFNYLNGFSKIATCEVNAFENKLNEIDIQ